MRRYFLTDLYHSLLAAPWWVGLLIVSVAFLLGNMLFAMCYLRIGGIVNVRPDSFADAFFFSVQTMGTIGYGDMHPQSPGSHMLVTLQVFTSVLMLAIATGLIFAKFSRIRARVMFSHAAVIAPLDGVPTLMFRVSNQRGNYIVEATLRAMLMRKERTREGRLMYRMYDLPLVRNHSLAFTRGWMLMHRLTADSPLYGATPEALAEVETEIILSLTGIDETSSQPIHARHSYLDDEIHWGARLADMLSEEPDGRLRVDFTRFHALEPTAPTPDFPYPR